jgi:hypothetical protein
MHTIWLPEYRTQYGIPNRVGVAVHVMRNRVGRCQVFAVVVVYGPSGTVLCNVPIKGDKCAQASRVVSSCRLVCKGHPSPLYGCFGGSELD